MNYLKYLIMEKTRKFPSVILSMYGFNHIPIQKDIFEKNNYEKQKLKRIKAAYNEKMREMKRDNKGWSKDYMIFTNTIN